MIDQLLCVQLPRELAGRELKRKYSQELGINPDEIAAIYITPCQAKSISILQPAEHARSNLDGALGISDVYNDILASTHDLENAAAVDLSERFIRDAGVLFWTTSQGQSRNLSGHRHMSVTGLSNVIQVFEDIYKGKLRNIEYLECHACWGGCINGNLTVDNVYVTLSKILRLISTLPERDPELEAEVERRYPTEDFSLKGSLEPRAAEKNADDLKERVRRKKAEEAVMAGLPGLNCALCGAPTCNTFAKDVAAGTAGVHECVFLSDERLKQLRETYKQARKRPLPDET
jgi:hypothetical protein